MGLSTGLYVLNFDMARFKQSKGVTEKMLNAIITVNDITEMKKRDSGNTKTIIRPMISPHSASPLNPYISYDWLFKGLDKKKKN
jgi:hypothetical protein